MKDKISRSLLALILVLCITQAACTAGQLSQTVTALDTVATVATGVVAACTALEISGGLAAYATLCVGFGELLAKGASEAASELSSKDAAALKAAVISADLSAAIQATPGLAPAGTPSSVVAVINTASSALETFLKTLDPAASLSLKSSVAQIASAIASAPPNLSAKLTLNDRIKLHHVKTESNRALTAVKVWRVKHPKA